MQEEQVLVDYTTRVILKLKDKEIYQLQTVVPEAVRKAGESMVRRTARVAEMMEVLIKHGFVLKGSDGFIYADSETIGAQEVKKILVEQGFLDTEFQIFLEYRRKWGIL